MWNNGTSVSYINSHVEPRSIGKCAAYVRRAVETGGVKIQIPLPRIVNSASACDYGPSLEKVGYKPVYVYSGSGPTDTAIIPGQQYRSVKPAYKLYRYSDNKSAALRSPDTQRGKINIVWSIPSNNRGSEFGSQKDILSHLAGESTGQYAIGRSGMWAVGKSDSYILYDEERSYDDNKGLDLNKDHAITKYEAGLKVRDKLKLGMKEGYRG